MKLFSSLIVVPLAVLIHFNACSASASNFRISAVGFADGAGQTVTPAAGQAFGVKVDWVYENPTCANYRLRVVFQGRTNVFGPINWGCNESRAGISPAYPRAVIGVVGMQAGSHTLQVDLDPLNEVNESNEADNSVVIPVQVSPTPTRAPNLKVTSVEFLDQSGYPVLPIPDRPFVVAVGFNYTNPVCTGYRIKAELNGRTWFSGPIDWGCGLMGEPRWIAWMNASESKIGTHSLKVTVDGDNAIPESNENDNQMVVPLEISPTEFDTSTWDSVFRSQIPNDGAGGYAWLAMNHGGVVGSGSMGFGRAPWEPIRPGTPLTITNQFAIGSISKLITWIALLKVWESGGKQFSLEQPFWPLVRRIFPNVDPLVTNITVRQLHQHRSGIRRDVHYKDAVRTVLQEPLFATPGTPESYNYISTNPLLLSYLIEELSGQPYADYVKQHVLAPMGISNMQVNATETYPVLGYSTASPQRLGFLQQTTPTYEPPTGGWWASAVDMGLFLKGLHECIVLSPELSRSEGLGGGPTQWGWNGWVIGSYRASIVHWVDGVAAVMFINSDYGDPSHLLHLAHKTSSKPVALNYTRTNGLLNMWFRGQAGYSFTLEKTESLGPPAWVRETTFKGSNGITSVPPVPLQGSSSVFRLKRNR